MPGKKNCYFVTKKQVSTIAVLIYVYGDNLCFADSSVRFPIQEGL